MKLWKSLLASLLSILLMLSMAVSALAYTDVGDDNSYKEYIKIVDSLGLIPANTMGDFNPVGYLSRGEALVTAYRMVSGTEEGLDDYRSGGQLFDDVDSANPYFPYVNWAYDNALITNEIEEAKFSPADPISGAEFLTLFVKVGGIDIDAVLNGSGGEGGENGEMSGEGEGAGESGGDGEGTTTGEYTYPDSFIDASIDFAGDVTGDETAITREVAAMTIAQLLWYQDSDTNIDMATLYDDAGNYLNCFATQVYGLNKVNLSIRATKNRTMGYEFEGDVLLSNGSVLTTDEDLSRYIGHPISITYRDTDRSGTLTEDESIIDYTVNSLMILEPALADITLTNYTEFTVSSIGLSFNITNASKFYYNDELWSEDALLNLVTIAGGTGNTAVISNRPNMKFTVVPSEIADAESGVTLVLELFVEEHHPAKIVDITNGVYTLYDYYNRGTDKEYQQFSTSNIKFMTSGTSVGDYVNFYTSNGTCYILEGSAKKTTIKSIGTGNVLTLADDTVVTPHQLFRRSNTMPETGKEVVVITEDVLGTYYLGWEYPVSLEKLPALVRDYTEQGDTVLYKIYDCASKSEMDLSVNVDNIAAGTAIEEGEFIYYSKDGDGQYAIERANISDKVKLGVETDEYFVESSTGKIYKKSKYYYGNLYTDTFKEDYYKMILDVSGNVLALE